MPLRIGVVGCGQFARLELRQVTRIPGVRVSAAFDPHTEAAAAVAREYGAAISTSAETLVNRQDVDLVYVAAPPALHHPIGCGHSRPASIC